jgi:hypothetical protein
MEDVALNGNVLYVADDQGGLQILQLNPEQFSTVFLPLIR